MKTIAQQLGVEIGEDPFEIKDGNGRVIYRELSNGLWDKHKYDTMGNLTRSEDSYGSWESYSYDEHGDIASYENSDGDWAKY